MDIENRWAGLASPGDHKRRIGAWSSRQCASQQGVRDHNQVGALRCSDCDTERVQGDSKICALNLHCGAATSRTVEGVDSLVIAAANSSHRWTWDRVWKRF